MPAFKDLTGQKINNWIVKEFKGFSKYGASLWLVECDCYKHTQRIKNASSIKNSKTCGCDGLPDLTGKLFGRWKVIKYIEKDFWLCECQCKDKTIRKVDGRRLRSGGSKSCGCLTIDKSKQYNSYDFSNGFGIGYDSKNTKFYFDLSDYEKIKNYYWSLSSDGYMIAKFNCKSIRMHRFLLNQLDVKNQIDHINRNKTDNRKENLRIVTAQQNSFNQSKRYDNKSGVTGVVWWERDNNWRAQIKYNYKGIFLGYYEDIEDAIKARLNAELKYFGKDFAPQRHLFKQYGIGGEINE